MNNKKRNTMVAGLAVTLLVGASSFAYFTDRAESTFTGKAGTVTLDGAKASVGNQNMAPGDVSAFSVDTKYTGTLDAKVRVRLMQDESANGVNKLGDGKATQGFVLMNGEEVVEVTPEGAIIEVEGVVKPQQEIAVPLSVKLLEKSDNTHQNADIKVDYIIEALQDKNVEGWKAIGGGEIEIVKAK